MFSPVWVRKGSEEGGGGVVELLQFFTQMHTCRVELIVHLN